MIIKPLVSVGLHLQIMTPQTNAGISLTLRTHVFSYILIWVNFARRWQKILAMLTDRWISRMPGPHQLLPLDTISAMPTVKWMPTSCTNKRQQFTYLSPLQCRLLSQLLYPRTLCPKRISRVLAYLHMLNHSRTDCTVPKKCLMLPTQQWQDIFTGRSKE